MTKVLVATQKPFAAPAVEVIKDIIGKADFELVMLEKYEDKSNLLKAIENVNAVIIRSDKITAEVLDAAKELKVVVRAGAGFDNVDLTAATSHEVIVQNTPGQNSNAVAELVIGMMLLMARNNYNGKSGTELKGKKLGLHAYGNVGKCVSKIAKGFGMEVYAFDPFIDKSVIENDGVIAIDSIEELYSTCQYVSLHIPANEKTKKSINLNLMSMMPKNATIINTARKEVICEESLIKVLEARPDFKYVADIAPDCKAKVEELFPGRFFFTPKKSGAQTAEANINAAGAAANQIVEYFKNGKVLFQVNK